MNFVLVNGTPAHSIPVTDRAVQYGDGIFETVAVRNGRAEFWPQHMKRLGIGCQCLRIVAPEPDLLADEARRLCQDIDKGVLKIIISRGGGGRGYSAPATMPATRILSMHPWPEWPDESRLQGVAVRICTTRLARNPQLAGIKHLNRLEQVLARNEWNDPAIVEGLMLDTEGELVEGTMSNLFMVRSGVLLTPGLSQCGVAGIMREIVLHVAQQHGITCETGCYSLDDLSAADELFLTNSIIGILPVQDVNQVNYDVSDNITNMLSKLIADIRTEYLL